MDTTSNQLETKPEKRGWLTRARGIGFALITALLLPCTLWAAAALYIDVRVPWLRTPLAVFFLLAVLAV